MIESVVDETVGGVVSGFSWSHSGQVCLELVEAEILKNGKYVYGRENLTQIEFEQYVRELHGVPKK